MPLPAKIRYHENSWEELAMCSDTAPGTGSMNYYPLFRVRSWNNGVRCMSFCSLMDSCISTMPSILQYHHNEHDSVSNHQPQDCLLNRLFRHRSEKTSKLRVTGLCVGNSPVTGEFHAQRASITENGSICWCHHVLTKCLSDNRIITR